MNKRQVFMATVCFTSVCGVMYGQAGEKAASFQYFINSDTGPGNVTFRVDALGSRAVKDKPFSATEERRTVQMLGDGTKIDKSETDKYYRDAQGRTRIERDNGGSIMISDPVAGNSVELSANSKTARKMMVMRSGSAGVAGGAMTAMAPPPNIVMMDKMKAEMQAAAGVGVAHGGEIGLAIAGEPGDKAVFTKSLSRAVDGEKVALDKAATEDLGTQIINGVPAQGTRSTITIPAGQIGNDREIKVVSERWFSSDLQMLIRSSNKDPRFGETTYELNNVLQGAQDPTLFQIPSDFTTSGLK